MNLARRIWGPCLLITVCMGSFGIAGLSLGFAVTLLVSLAAIEPALLKQRFSRLPLVLSALLFLLWGLVSLFWTEADRLLPVISDWSRWLILIPAVGFMMTDEVRQGIWRAFVAVQLIVALWSLYVGMDCAIDPSPFPHAYECMNRRIPHGNIEASWILSLGALLALIWLEGRWRWVIAVLLTLPLFIIGNRTGFFTLGIGLLVALTYEASLRPWRARVLLASAAIAAAGIALNPALQLRISEALQLERYQVSQLHQAEQNSEGLRAAYWRAGFIALRDKPLIGHGMGSWPEVYRGLQPQVEGPAISANPHSSYVQIAVEQGLIGLFLFLGLLVALWQASSWLAGFEAVFCRLLIATFAAGSLLNTWTHDGASSRMFLVLMVLCLAGLRSPHSTSAVQTSAESADAQQALKAQSRDRRSRRRDKARP